MKIIISPAKSLDLLSEIPKNTSFSLPFFQEEAKTINLILKELSPNELATLMKISYKLAELNWQRNQSFSLPFSPQNARQAIFSFDGDVYDGLNIRNFSEEEIKELQEKLRILSGLYGILKPLDLIQAYRLEMGTKLSIRKSKDLYHFWQEKLTSFLNNELSENELLINLASQEYFKVLNINSLKAKMITPIFKEWNNGTPKIVSFYAKKARGLMVQYLIKENVTSIDAIKKFNYERYVFDDKLSQKTGELIFIR